MADPNISIIKTLHNEGGFVNNPADRGGPTNMGITQADMPDVDIKAISIAQAETYYLEHFWKKFYSQIEDQNIANKLFDMGFLFGVGTATIFLQTCLNVEPTDGVVGQHTLDAINAAEPVSLLTAFKSILVTHALGIGAKDPSQRQFVKGWINRINQ
jgi:lysozyme family protein